MATDLAEFVGAAVGLNLLFGVPLFPAGLITAVVAFGILALEQRGYRRFELAIAALLGIVLLGFAYDLLRGRRRPVRGRGRARAALPGRGRRAARGRHHRRDRDAPRRLPALGADQVAGPLPRRRRALRAAALPAPRRRRRSRRRRADQPVDAHGRRVGVPQLGAADTDSIEAAHAGLGQLVGGGAALAFAVALLASGLSSSSVGTYAGQVVMQGFIRRRIPLMVRRARDDAAGPARPRPGAAGHRRAW